jgi:hypothetical protein
MEYQYTIRYYIIGNLPIIMLFARVYFKRLVNVEIKPK